jgi:hypothetical protein
MLGFREHGLAEVQCPRMERTGSSVSEKAELSASLLGGNLARQEARKGPETVGGGTPALVTVIEILLHPHIARP